MCGCVLPRITPSDFTSLEQLIEWLRTGTQACDWKHNVAATTTLCFQKISAHRIIRQEKMPASFN